MYTDARKAYRDTHAASSISEASPHKLVALLFDACHENLATAKGAMTRGEKKRKEESLKKAMGIIVQIQAVLHFEKGGFIATRLDDLYTFCTNRLALANAINDTAMVDEVYKVIAELKLGWVEIAKEVS